MAVDVDYYALLGVPRNADSAAVEAAVKKAMREWRKRTEAADLSVRQEAELKVKQIEDARTTLLDPSKRAAYDQDLAHGVKQVAPPTSTGGTAPGGGSWLDQAEAHLAVGDYHSAAYAARQATQTMGDSARSWWVRSRANAGLSIWQDALYEAKQAVALEENNADYHFNLGLVHEEMSQYDQAINSFRRAGSCDPSNPVYELAVGGIYLSNGRPEQALPIIEAVYNKHPNDESTNYYLGSTLIELAERVPAVKDADSYAVTSPAEIQSMRGYAERAKNLQNPDAEVSRNADHILTYLSEMEKMKFRPPWQWAGAVAFAMGDFGCFGMFIGIFLAVALLFLPLILLISSFAAFSAGNAGAGIILLLLAIGSGWLWWRLSWVPAWKDNKRKN